MELTSKGRIPFRSYRWEDTNIKTKLKNKVWKKWICLAEHGAAVKFLSFREHMEFSHKKSNFLRQLVIISGDKIQNVKISL